MKKSKNDFETIKLFLHLPVELSLKIETGHDEGFYFRNCKTVMIGTKNGYNRRLLVHECLHATGLQHHDKIGYDSVIKYDEYSKNIEREIFG